MSGGSATPRSPPLTPLPPTPSPPPSPSPTTCSCPSQVASAQSSASQNIASISAAAVSSVSSAQAAQASLQQSIAAANSALQSLQTSYSSALSSASASLGVASNNVASATSYANSAAAAQASAHQTASSLLASVQNSASVALSLVAFSAASSASRAIASATSLAFVAESSASLAISRASAQPETPRVTATFEVGEDSVATLPPAKSPTSTAIASCDLTSTTALRVITAVLSTVLLFLFAILIFVLITRCREHRKSRNRGTAEALLEVKEAREMKPHDVDLLYAKQSLESGFGSSASYYRKEEAPNSPITSSMKPPPLFSPEIKRSRSFPTSRGNQFPSRNTVSISRQPSERRPSTPVPFSVTPFSHSDFKRLSSPIVSTHILSPRSIQPQTKKPALQVTIPNRASDTSSSSQDVSLSQFPHLQGRSLTHPDQLQKIFWSFPPTAAEPPHPAFASGDSSPSFGFQSIPPPLSPKFKPSVFPTYSNLKTNSIKQVQPQLKPSKSLSSLRQKVAGESPLEMKQRSKSVTDKTVSALISEIDALSRDQERRRRIEGWLDTPGWGEGSVKSAATGRTRQHSVTTTYTQEEGNESFHIGEAF